MRKIQNEMKVEARATLQGPRRRPGRPYCVCLGEEIVLRWEWVEVGPSQAATGWGEGGWGTQNLPAHPAGCGPQGSMWCLKVTGTLGIPEHPGDAELVLRKKWGDGDRLVLGVDRRLQSVWGRGEAVGAPGV